MTEVLLGFGSKVMFWGGGLLLLGLAVFVHELGHFLAARWLGLKVEVFSIGLGPAVWKYKRKGITYKLCWIPFGGYVMVPQLDPAGMECLQGTAEEPNASLPDASPWKRMVVSVAGPLGNLVLAVVLAYLVFWVQGAVNVAALDTRVGKVLETSEAWKAGLRNGDRILTVNGGKVDDWVKLVTESALAGSGGAATIQFERDGQTHEVEMPLQKDAFHDVYMLTGVEPKLPVVVSEVSAGFPAVQAGIRPGDVLRTVDGQVIWNWDFFVSVIQKKGEAPLTIGITRGTEEHVFEMTPQYDDALGRVLVGITCSSDLLGPGSMFSTPWAQIKGDVFMIKRFLQGMIAPKNKGERAVLAKNTGGPLLILDMFQQAVQSGFAVAASVLRMICVNLAILNLLPIPVLDGGHILFALYETVTRRKPHPRVVAVLVNVCAVLLIGLMLFLVGRDAVNKVKKVRLQREMEQQAK